MTLPFPIPSDPVDGSASHVLDGIRIDGMSIGVELWVRPDGQGAWRGRLRFTLPDGFTRETADIFAGSAVPDLLAAARGLREHHYRDLYRSLT
jgi:hypothetical protein